MKAPSEMAMMDLESLTDSLGLYLVLQIGEERLHLTQLSGERSELGEAGDASFVSASG